MITSKNILSLLKSNDISTNEKEKIIANHKKIVTKAVKNLNAKELLDFLFDKKTPKSLKWYVSSRIDELADKKSVMSDIIIDEFKGRDVKCERLLYGEYFPKSLKAVIIMKLFGNKLIGAVRDKSVSFYIKKLIIDLTYSDENVLTLLAKGADAKVVDYVLQTKFDNDYIIKCCINNRLISEDIKERVVIEKVNMNNLFSVIDSYLISKAWRDRIYEIKSKEIEDYIRHLKNRKLIDTLNSYSTPDEIAEKIWEMRSSNIKKAIKKLDLDSLIDIFRRCNNAKLAQKVLELCPLRVKIATKSMYTSEVMIWLKNENVPVELKNYLYKYRTRKVLRAIDKLNFSDIKSFALSASSFVPDYIQKLILERKRDLIVESINNTDEKEAIEAIIYGSMLPLLRTEYIKLKLNQDNVLNALSQTQFYPEIMELILSVKKDDIALALNKMSLNDLILLKDIEFVNIKGRIISSNSKMVSERLKVLDNSDAIKYLNSSEVPSAMKIIILGNRGVKISNIINCVELIRYNDAEIVLKNYDKIKSIVESVGIDFSSFVQYGCGTNTYKDWLKELNTIITNNKEENFIKSTRYLFNNYYLEDKEKENPTLRILHFLQVLDNYNSNQTLLDDLASCKARLNDDEQSNLHFLLNLKSDTKSSVTKLSQINDYRAQLYQKYKDTVQSDETSIYVLKEIFNQLVFCNANVSLTDIGGTETLKTLKKNNIDNSGMVALTDELINCSMLIEGVNATNNKDKLRENLMNVLNGEQKQLIKLQNLFSRFDTKVSNLFELDSRINLTNLYDAQLNNDVVDIKLSSQYGGIVLDFSNKKYVLYAHVLSNNESIADLVNGTATASSNFISVSPISYLGQKYYYDYSDDPIIAFDTIPKGSFIYSSVSNMGSNGAVANNSLEVERISRTQRGILETSAVTKNNSEGLLYREGLKAKGLILPGGRRPSDEELKYHLEYNLPFIITQGVEKTIENPQPIEKSTVIDIESVSMKDDVQNLLKKINQSTMQFSKKPGYTGREIAIITDSHSMYEPTLAVLEEIRKKGITEIYSLGDNIGVGSNPCEVLDLLEDYNVKSVAGNSEYYNTLGTEPFTYFYKEKLENQEWTYDKLGSRVSKLKLFPASIDLVVGDKKIALCHFANDIRWDYSSHSTWGYQTNFVPGVSSKQFMFTNSEEAKKEIENYVLSSKKGDKRARGFVSSYNEPLFDGKMIDQYDAIIQGHVHFDMKDHYKETDIYTLRAVGMGWKKEDKDSACYYVLKEKEDGKFDVEKRTVPFNKNLLIANIHASGIPHKEKVLSFLKS